jgi:hypothetical protein
MNIWTRNWIFKYNVRSCPTYLSTYLCQISSADFAWPAYGLKLIWRFPYPILILYCKFVRRVFLVTYLYLKKTFFCSISKWVLHRYIRRIAQNCVSGILCTVQKYLGRRKLGGQGAQIWADMLPFFNQGVDYAHHISLSPRIFRCSYGPEHSCCSMKTTNFSQMFPTPQKNDDKQRK